MENPIKVGPWQMRVHAHQDASSAIVAQKLLKEVGAPSLYEIWSLTVNISEEGTGDLASAAIGNADLVSGISNDDARMMRITRQGDNGAETYWHWGRDNQIGGIQPTIYLPPGFYWEGELWAYEQNGAGAAVTYMFNVIYRVVTFRETAWVNLVAKVLPLRADKTISDT